MSGDIQPTPVLLQTAFVSPALADASWHSGVIGEVVDGCIELDDYDDVFVFTDAEEAFDDGTSVRVIRHSNGQEYAVDEESYQRAQTAKRADKRAEAWERRREKNEMRDEAERFWGSYAISFQFDVGIKGRVSGLTRGSSGTGRSSRTVEHLLVQEAFSEGRLERDEGEFLCGSGSGKFEFSEERRTDGEGESYVPPVTCQSCLDLMERWKED